MSENLYPNNELPPFSPIEEKIQSYHTKEPAYAEKLLEDFKGIGLYSIFYGLFYCFCLYKNGHGITSPLWVAATLLYYLSAFKRLGIPLVKSTLFYGAASVLLGVSNCLTDSFPLHFFNYTAILLLMFLFLIKHFYEPKNWSVGQYFLGLVCTVFGSITCVDGLFKSCSLYRKNHKREANPFVRNILLGLCISTPMLLVIGFLLACADDVFSRLVFESFLFRIVVPQNLFGILFMSAFGILACHSVLLYLARHSFQTEHVSARNGEPVIAITFCSTLTILYILFCFIQIKYLFLGLGTSSLPDGFTYAGYARKGFFQLLFVCIINLCLVLFCLHFYRDNKILKGILTVISLCTFIMTASSAYRMLLYIKAYQLTFLRVIVLWALAVIFLLMCGVVVYTYKPSFPLFDYGVVIVTCFYIVLSLSKPDAYIAEFNLTQLENHEVDYIDTSYLYYHLSADAAPVIAAHGFFDCDTVIDMNENVFATSYDRDYVYYEDGYQDGSYEYVSRQINNYKTDLEEAYHSMTARSFNFSIHRAWKKVSDSTQ